MVNEVSLKHKKPVVRICFSEPRLETDVGGRKTANLAAGFLFACSIVLLKHKIMSGEYKQSLITELIAKGEGLYVSGKYHEAVEVYEIILAIDPENKGVLRDMVFAMTKIKEGYDAEEVDIRKGLIVEEPKLGMTSSMITGLDGNRIEPGNLFKQNSGNTIDPDDYEVLQRKHE